MPFSWLYGKIADVRNDLFERGVFASFALGAPAVSVGNLTVGGTGKTPMVAFVAETLADAGARVGVLTRGYGRADERTRVVVSNFDEVLSDARTAGDEPVELAKKLLGRAVVIADADRVAAAKFAIQEFGVDGFVLDDAFQHRRARRDLDIVLVDATDPFGGGKALPFGRLREPLENIARAGAVVVTRADLSQNLDETLAAIAKLTPAPVFVSRTELDGLVEIGEYLTGRMHAARRPEPSRDAFFAFCGLGNPENFFAMLRREGFQIAGAKAFGDHHAYAPSDIAAIDAESSGATHLVTTAKDAVKLESFDFRLPCHVALARPRIENEQALRELIGTALAKAG